MSYQIIHNDCLIALKDYPDNYFSSVITDPPAGISFMGKDFDTFHSPQNFQDFIYKVFTEVIRVLKPGGHALVWAIPRTSHHTAMGLERAGFEIRDKIYHLFGSGFPKSLNISKSLDKMKGVQRKVIGISSNGSGAQPNKLNNHGKGDTGIGYADGSGKEFKITEPSTDEAKQWEGWGTALKPAVEEWILCRKPLSEKSVAENVLKWGTGGLNINDCRVLFDTKNEPDTGDSYYLKRNKKYPDRGSSKIMGQKSNRVDITMKHGRFPANLILECICDEVKEGKAKGNQGHWSKTKTTGFGKFGDGKSEYKGVGEKDNMECLIHTNPECPCYILDKQSGKLNKQGISKSDDKSGWQDKYVGGDEVNAVPRKLYLDTGGASRFFYCAKPSKRERNRGVEDLSKDIGHNRFDKCKNCGKYIFQNPNRPSACKCKNPERENNIIKGNHHPTIKPISLMRYLIRLITPPGGIVLDPFAGSGTTGIACKLEGFDCTLIEREKEYCDIIQTRIHAWKNKKLTSAQQKLF